MMSSSVPIATWMVLKTSLRSTLSMLERGIADDINVTIVLTEEDEGLVRDYVTFIEFWITWILGRITKGM